MQIPLDARDLADLLASNPWIHAAWLRRHATGGPYIVAQTSDVAAATDGRLPLKYRGLPIHYQESPGLYPLISYNLATDPAHPNQACQNEPVHLGTQIQPKGANWLGTAGAPVHWLREGRHHYGILSNWHVMYVGPGPDLGRSQHQPTVVRAPIAHLTHHSGPDPTRPNLVDAAIADAIVQGYHTIALKILGIGQPAPTPRDAAVGNDAVKSGRTTGITSGACTATGAAVRVGYGDFDAIFQDQDIYQPHGPPFSAPGDSGSLILHAPSAAPMSLLFAGGGNITVGNPIRHVIAALAIDFQL